MEGEFYHVYNRGNSKQIIFKDGYDYERFLRLLYLCNSTQHFNLNDVRDSGVDFFKFDRKEKLVAIGTYCLMPNHFHILLSPLQEGGVSQFMKKLGTAYAAYFNKKYDRTGTLFEGRFKAEWVDTDRYLKYLFAYIHLNSLKLINPEWRTQGVKNLHQAQSYLSAYHFSSLPDYLDSTREEKKILDTQYFPKYFASGKDTWRDLQTWFSFRTDLKEVAG